MAKVIIFSGAGISAESGIATFRDNDGLWEKHSIEEVCTKGCLESNRLGTFEFYNQRRIELKNANPNYAHDVIAELKNKYPNDIDVITQNVDDLFEKARCKDILHLHGFLTSITCMRKSCNYKKDIGYTDIDYKERCPKCNKTLRPDVVFFYERAPMYKKLHESLKSCEMFVAIGTSGYVMAFNDLLTSKMKIKILNNLESSKAVDEELFTKVIYSPATKAIDEIKKDIEKFLDV